MRFDEIDFQPTPRKLRMFGIGSGVFYTLIGLVLMAWFPSVPLWVSILFWVSAVAVITCGILRPEKLKWVYIVLNVIALPIVILVNTVLLGLAFYLVLTPVAIYRRRKHPQDPLRLTFPGNEGEETYWLDHEGPKPVKRYFRQY